MAVRYPDINDPMIPELIPNQRLIDLRKQFGVPGEFLLDDYNEYFTNMNDNQPIEKIGDGVSPDLKEYSMASVGNGGGGGITELLQSQDGAIGYVKPLDSIDSTGITGIDSDLASKFDQYKNYKRTDQDYIDEINLMRRTNPNFNSYTDVDLKQIIDMGAFSKRSNFEVPEKTGILQNIKDGGSKLLDFIKKGGVIGNLASGILPEQRPESIFMRNYYGGKDGSNLTSSGSIASGLMKGYNPVSGGGLYTLTGGRYGEEPTYGLQNAYDRRMDTIRKTLAKQANDIATGKRQKPVSVVLRERLEKIREEKAREAEALRVSEENRIRQAQQRQTQIDDRIEAEANQRYRDDPGAKSYSGGFDRSTNNYNDPFSPGDTE